MLYYPGTVPPDEAIFQAVLYWDFLASVSPPQWAPQGDAMRRLVDADLYRPVFVHDGRYDQIFMKGFAATLPTILRDRPLDDILAPSRIPGGNRVPPIHNTRFPLTVRQYLLELGLLRMDDPDDPQWLFASPEIRHLLFAIAAEHVAGESSLHGDKKMFAYTLDDTFFWDTHRDWWSMADDRLYGRFRDRRDASEPVKGPLRTCWQIELGDLLPTPSPGTDLSNLIKFRERYADERLRLVRGVSQLQNNLRDIDGDPISSLNNVKGEVRAAVNDLQRAASSRAISLIKRPIYSFIAAGAGLNAIKYPEFGVIWTVVSGIAVNLATAQIAGPDPNSRPFTYLHQTGKKFGQKRKRTRRLKLRWPFRR
ncbi:hypothetical protein [Spongiactinospora sp. 9N601]|uniref:hypothetical protein n=1 Tax=Spongiactinospora sp. 9N601 TaxID=3375149 RepID=UPI003796C0ED